MKLQLALRTCMGHACTLLLLVIILQDAGRSLMISRMSGRQWQAQPPGRVGRLDPCGWHKRLWVRTAAVHTQCNRACGHRAPARRNAGQPSRPSTHHHQGKAHLLAQQQIHSCWVGLCMFLPAWPLAVAWASATWAPDCRQVALSAAALHQAAWRLQPQTLSARVQRRFWAGIAAGRAHCGQWCATQVAAAGLACPAAPRRQLAPPELAPAVGTGAPSAEASHAQQVLA